MGDLDNITLETLAKAAVASNMSAKDTLESMQVALEDITPEQLEKVIQQLKKNLNSS